MARPSLKIVPLGGLGHIGGNMTVLETEHDLVVIDCGVLFPTAEQPGVDYVIPDASYVHERRDKLKGFIITHGHEDHTGALPYVLREMPAPVWGTRLTLELLRNKLGEWPDLDVELKLMKDGERFRVGELEVEPIPVTHSIPDAVALAIETPAGLIVHSGDFKLDEEPLDGRVTDFDAFRRLAQQGVLVLLSDSTNAERSGCTWPERLIAETFQRIVAEAPQRVFVTGFASNLHRLQTIISASEAAGRRVIPLGRSMQQNIQLGLEKGYIRARYGAIADASEFARMRRSAVTVIAGGSQGEPQSSMVRIAKAQHGQVFLEPGDRVIFSSRRIPGNERAIGNMINSFFRLGAEVIDDRTERVHTSGHAFGDEQRRVIEACRPKFFVPIHGEYRHLVHHAQIANGTGIPSSDIFIIEDGMPLHVYGSGADAKISRADPVHAGHLFVEGKGIGDVGEVVLRDRRMLSTTGLVLCIVILDETGGIIGGPDIITRGVIDVDANSALIEQATTEVRRALEQEGHFIDVSDCSQEVRQTLRRFFKRELDRRPLVLPVVMSI